MAIGGVAARRSWAILGLDRVLAERERERPEEVRLLRWHLDRSRDRIAALQPHARSGMVEFMGFHAVEPAV